MKRKGAKWPRYPKEGLCDICKKPVELHTIAKLYKCHPELWRVRHERRPVETNS